MHARRVIVLLIVFIGFSVSTIPATASAQSIPIRTQSGPGLPGPIIIIPDSSNPQKYEIKLLSPAQAISPSAPAPIPSQSNERKVIYENKKGEIKAITIPPPSGKTDKEEIEAHVAHCKKKCIYICKNDLKCLSVCRDACEE
jgi:hypothetical protein